MYMDMGVGAGGRLQAGVDDNVFARHAGRDCHWDLP